MADGVVITPFHDRYARDRVAMWRASKQRALGVKDAHSFDEHLHFLRTGRVARNAVCLALDPGLDAVVGRLPRDGAELNRLHVHVDHQRRGIGTRLLNLAKRPSPGGRALYTFEVNAPARAFYANHGFTVTARGQDNEEGLPDLRLVWPGVDPGGGSRPSAAGGNVSGPVPGGVPTACVPRGDPPGMS